MATNVYRIQNHSPKTVQVTVLSSSKKSHDLVIGANKEITYTSFVTTSSPVPDAANAEAFKTNRMRLRVGDKLHAIYRNEAVTRLTTGDVFSAAAPAIPGYAGEGNIEITVYPLGEIKAEHRPYITGPSIAATTWAEARAACYGVAEGKVTEKVALQSQWQPWSDIGTPTAPLTGPITAVSWVTGRYGIYALDTNGAIQERAWAGTKWSDWNALAAPKSATLKDLAAVYWIADQYGIYAVDANGEVHEKVFKPGGWQEWGTIGKPEGAKLAGPIAGVCWSTGRYGVYALDTNGAVWQKWWATTWSGWEKIDGPPGATLKTISAADHADRNYLIAGISTAGDLWLKRYVHGWGEWINAGRPGTPLLDGALGVLGKLGSSFGIIVRDTDHTLSVYNGKTWTALDES